MLFPKNKVTFSCDDFRLEFELSVSREEFQRIALEVLSQKKSISPGVKTIDEPPSLGNYRLTALSQNTVYEKIGAIKELRAFFRIGLKEAKDTVEGMYDLRNLKPLGSASAANCQSALRACGYDTTWEKI